MYFENIRHATILGLPNARGGAATLNGCRYSWIFHPDGHVWVGCFW